MEQLTHSQTQPAFPHRVRPASFLSQPRSNSSDDRASVLAAILNIGLLAPAIFRWVLPVTLEIPYSFVFCGVSIPYSDMTFLLLPFLALVARPRVQRATLILGALALIWSVCAGLLQDPHFDLYNASAAFDTYYPIILVSLIPIRLASAKPLRWLLFAVILYMCAQITAYSLGWLTWDRPLGYVIGDTSIIRINTTMGASTGAALLLAIIYAIHLELTGPTNRLERLLAGACTFEALLLLSARGAFLVIIGAAFFYVFNNRSLARRLFSFKGLFLGTLISLGIVLAFLAVGGGLKFRVNELGGAQDLNLFSSGRSSLWTQSSDTRDGWGLLGSGVGNVDPRGRPAETSRIDWDSRTHNTYLAVYYESGLIGLILFCAVFGTWLAATFRRGRRLPGYAFVVAYCAVAFMLESCPLSVDYMLPLLVLMSVVRQKDARPSHRAITFRHLAPR